MLSQLVSFKVTRPSLWPFFLTSACLYYTCAFLLVFFIFHQYKSWKRLAHIPGPKAAHFSILWLLNHGWNGNLFPCMTAAGKKFGSLVRIGPNLLLCSDPDELRRLSGTRSPYTKGPAYDAGRVTDTEPHVASQRDPAKHKRLRAKMGPAYSMDVQPTIDQNVATLVDLIDRKYAAEPMLTRCTRANPEHALPAKTMDFGQKMDFYSIDTLCDFAFGENVGLLKSDSDVGDLTRFSDNSIRKVTMGGLIPWVSNMRFKWPFKYVMPQEKSIAGFEYLLRFATDVVDRRMNHDAKPKNDMMQGFFKAGMTRNQLMQQVYIHMIAGTDTTSKWARMTMLCLLTCPPAYIALQREIDAGFSSGQLSSPVATDAELRRLGYLDAVLCEALRKFPPSVSPSKLSPSVVDTVCGTPVPGGTQIGANIPGVMLSESVFGADAECFRPERWLEAAQEPDGQSLGRMKSTLDLVFGAGKFHCVGTTIAFMEVRKLFAELMRRFDFSVVKNEQPLRVESFAIMVVHDFQVRVTRRVMESK
ncbi:unnamed protein product [Periconia digitata]|uniref:Cytochrome P450 n=1 Tax=Periconia digitata TaxID=1303443 RepID=A0A9W4UAV9_9PLEO|nr:unnamed protein product [Periconia digitata]